MENTMFFVCPTAETVIFVFFLTPHKVRKKKNDKDGRKKKKFPIYMQVLLIIYLNNPPGAPWLWNNIRQKIIWYVSEGSKYMPEGVQQETGGKKKRSSCCGGQSWAWAPSARCSSTLITLINQLNTTHFSHTPISVYAHGRAEPDICSRHGKAFI